MAATHIEISGWRYVPWRGDFYSQGPTQKHELRFASRALSSIEINDSIYVSCNTAGQWRKPRPRRSQ